MDSGMFTTASPLSGAGTSRGWAPAGRWAWGRSAVPVGADAVELEARFEQPLHGPHVALSEGLWSAASRSASIWRAAAPASRTASAGAGPRRRGAGPQPGEPPALGEFLWPSPSTRRPIRAGDGWPAPGGGPGEPRAPVESGRGEGLLLSGHHAPPGIWPTAQGSRPASSANRGAGAGQPRGGLGPWWAAASGAHPCPYPDGPQAPRTICHRSR